MNPAPIVYVVDDDPSVSRALARLFRIAGLRLQSFGTAKAFLDLAHLETPSCLVLDVQLPGMNGLDLQKELKQRGWAPPIVFITGHGNVPMAVEAMRNGAVHFLPKPCDNNELLKAIRQALDHEEQQLTHQQETSQIRRQMDLLTPREQEVFRLAAAGVPNKNIATQLGVCIQTVKLHRGHMMHKLQLESVADLVHFAEKVTALLPDQSDRT